jgi:hypothetical protein
MTIRYEPQTPVTITMARKWLSRNAENNRRPRFAKIAQYTRDMHNGRWRDTGDAIRFDTQGRMIDGQNRCHAVIEALEYACTPDCTHPADKPPTVIHLNVAYDVEPDAILVMDTGAARTFSNALSFDGVRNPNNVGAVIRWVMMWDKGRFTGTGGRGAPTHAEMMARYAQDRDRFDTAAACGRDVQLIGLGAAGPFSVAFYLFHRIDGEQTHAFFDRLVSGTEMTKNHPILTLRNRLIRDRLKLTRPHILALTIRGWNAYREDRLLPNIVAVGAAKLTNQNMPRPR